ncbi:MAG: helix-turn-helix transcriptional regulator, partial [Flavobacteriales bacterium]|nr:helix-turn-helix transcriptional regulator [Flavobacteriales bacterium]
SYEFSLLAPRAARSGAVHPVHSVDRFLPDGYCYVVIDLTETPKFIYDNHSLKEIQSCRRVWFSGIRENYITIPSGRESEMFIIYFQKGRAHPFVEIPMYELTDTVVDGELVLSSHILDLRDLLLETPDIQQRFTKAASFLLQTFAGKLKMDPMVDYAVQQILRQPHALTIQHLSSEVGYSQKHLIKRFKDLVGITPKSLLKITRFQQTIAELDKQQYSGWSHMALDCGYFDQAHFIHDFKNISGFTPGQYLAMQRDFTNYVAVG